jgi:glycosyltransferase involved in cell wall biosynthesis
MLLLQANHTMKILHILYSGLGGHGNVFFSMVNADVQKEFEYAAIFNGVEPVREEYVRDCREKNISFAYVQKKPGFHPGFYSGLYREIKKADPDIVFLHSGMAVLPAKLAKLFSGRIKKILVRETQANHLKTKGDWIRLALSMIFANRVVYLSEEYRQQVKQQLRWLYRDRKTSVIPNGINLDIFTAKPHDHSVKIVLGMQSRLVNSKDHATLFKAIAIIKKQDPASSIQLMIAGDGDNKATLVKLAEELGIVKEVIFTGQLNETALVDFLQKTDIYIHASLGETMSTAIMQAMACKKTIIASDVPGISNMIQHNKTGWLVEVKNMMAMADAIRKMINEPALASGLAANAFVYARENYANTTMFNRYKQIFYP